MKETLPATKRLFLFIYFSFFTTQGKCSGHFVYNADIILIAYNAMIKKYFLILPILFCAACGTQKAVRPDAPAPVVAESQSQTIHYKSYKGKMLTAVYYNNHSPLTVELREGNTTETLKQIQSWAKGVEYSNASTRWHVQEDRATLKRKGKVTVYREVD